MSATASYSADPTLYLYTSLTAGSSHIITATSRLETILKANKIPFRALDCATDEKARMLWGRRSRGKKLPGLVKYGSVIGDLEQIEEWNEYGELKEQIESIQDFGSMTTTSNPPDERLAAQTQKSDPSPRTPSETRHISISEPKDRDRDNEPSGNNPAHTLKSTDSPMTLAMRQAGAEAAAKAGQKKASGTDNLRAAQAPVPESSTAKTPTVGGTKLSAAAEDPSSSADVTAAKTPAQLTSESTKGTSFDKINDLESSSPTSSPNEATTSSNEAQLLDMRRSSSITKNKSRLSESTPVDKSETVLENTTETGEEKSVEKGDTNNENQQKQEQAKTNPPLQHRGSSIEAASIEEIRAIEAKNRIQEEDEEDDEGEKEKKTESLPSTKTAGTATAKGESTEDSTDTAKPQEKDAKDIEATGLSVGD